MHRVSHEDPRHDAAKRAVTMSPLDPWSKAAECARAIARVADPERRIVLESLRSVWIALCGSSLDEPDRTGRLATIAQIHAELMAGCRTAMH